MGQYADKTDVRALMTLGLSAAKAFEAALDAARGDAYARHWIDYAKART